MQEEVSANPVKRVTDCPEVSAMAQKAIAESNTARTYRSKALAALHENVSDLHRTGGIDTETMRKFDAPCLAPLRKPGRIASK